ncbi:segregation/condensation protein B [Clostridium gasigenes]|uniref:SMC-Scp complex subunit ScpB n=1 Tax=Clostridium gasigenes TaxID=94869 RepID=UPI001C0D81A1|nr:SMC-Scp complex subunit ScpB [Clostridium gasigenes]MBU3135086.1 segregation/condensation protein B [Clostridium gasigenes]
MDSLYIKQYEFEETARTTAIKSVIESLLFVSGEPLSIRDLHNNLEISIKVIESVIKEMVHDYEEDNRGIKLISINGEYQLVSKPQNSDSIQKLLKKNKRQSLSQASLESLAIVAYKQPITRIDIDEIRGVKSDSALQRLIERELIKDIGRLEVPGRPIIFGTTEEFLRQFGLKDLDELPSLDLYDEKDDDDEIEGSIDLLNKAMETL